MSISSRILQVREALGLNQNELAVKTGLGRSSISNWETGKYEPSNATLRQLADGTGVNYDWLRTGEGEMLVGNSPLTYLRQGNSPVGGSSIPTIAEGATRGYNPDSVRIITPNPDEDMTYDPAWVVPILLSAYHAVMHRDDLEKAREMKEQGKRFRVRLIVEQDDPKTTEPPPPKG